MGKAISDPEATELSYQKQGDIIYAYTPAGGG